MCYKGVAKNWHAKLKLTRRFVLVVTFSPLLRGGKETQAYTSPRKKETRKIENANLNTEPILYAPWMRNSPAEFSTASPTISSGRHRRRPGRVHGRL